MKKFYLILLLVGLFAVSCETSDEVLEDITDNKTEQPGDDAGGGTGDGISEKEREEIATKIFKELTSINVVSRTMVETSAEGAFLTMKFRVKPASCAPLMEKVWTHYVSMQAKYDLDSKKYVNMPIAEFDVNNDGVITIKASGEYLSDEFYAGKQEAFVRFGIMFKQQQIYSGYKSIEPFRWFAKSLSVPTEPNTIYYLAQDLIIPQNTEVESNSYDYKKGCFKIVLKGENPEIGERAFQYNGGASKQIPIECVAISGSIEKIGDRAFYGCFPLTSCIIGDGVKSIGISAFYGCGGLTTLAIPDSVTEIGDSAFAHCKELKSIILPRGIDRIGDEVFAYCGLTNITIPDGVTEIGYRAFWRSSIQNINLPYTVTSICEEAFSCCDNLQDITIPEGVTEIRKDTFFQCTGLQNLTISKNITTIAEGAFSGCSIKELTMCSPLVSKDYGYESPNYPLQFEKLIIGENIERIGSDAFRSIGSRSKSIIIPENVTSIGDGAFLGRITEELIINSPIIEKNNIKQFGDFEQIATPGWAQGFEIENLIIGDNIKRIGDAAVWCCGDLKRVTIPDSVTSLGKRAFDGCKNLISVTIPETVTEIGERVFQNCSSLQSIKGKFASDDNRCLIVDGELRAFAPAGLTSYTIPNSITKIRDGVFAGCVNLTSLNIPASVTEIEGGAFSDCSGLTSITLPDKITTIGDGVFNGCSGLTNIALPESITSIGNNAFNGCNSLTSITLPDKITTIGDGVFNGCNSLTSITIPEKVTSIGNTAFRGCSSLADIVIPDDVTSIGYSAFQNCSNLKSIKIPEKVNVIAEKTFEGCSSLVSVNIPEEVFWIINNAFSDCTSLSEVYCRRTTPPTLHSSNAFRNNAAGRKFYVPRESVDAYKSADKWSDYAADIVGYDFE